MSFTLAKASDIDFWRRNIQYPGHATGIVERIVDYLSSVADMPEDNGFFERVRADRALLWETIETNILHKAKIEHGPMGHGSHAFPNVHTIYQILKGTGLASPGENGKNIFGRANYRDEETFLMRFGRHLTRLASTLSVCEAESSLASYGLMNMQRKFQASSNIGKDIDYLAAETWLETRSSLWRGTETPHFAYGLAAALKTGRLPREERARAMVQMATALQEDKVRHVTISPGKSIAYNPANEALSVLEDESCLGIKLTSSQCVAVAWPMFLRLDFGPNGLGRLFPKHDLRGIKNQWFATCSEMITVPNNGKARSRLHHMHFFLDYHLKVKAYLGAYEELTGNEPVAKLDARFGIDTFPLQTSIVLLKALEKLTAPAQARRPRAPRPRGTAAPQAAAA